MFITELFEAVGELTKDLVEIVTESSAEFGELMTDGFIEMVVKDNSDYKTSFEKRDEANAIISSAKSKWRRTAENAERTYDEILNKVKENRKKKIELAKILEMQVQSNGFFSKIGHQLSFDQLDSIANIDDDVLVSSMFGLIGRMIRKDAVNDYYEDAKDFRTEVNVKIAKVNLEMNRLSHISDLIDEENELLLLLFNALEQTKVMDHQALLKLVKEMLEEQISSIKYGNLDKYKVLMNQFRQACRCI